MSDGSKKQFAVLDISDSGSQLTVETGFGCSKDALLYLMQELANDHGKIVTAKFNDDDDEVVVNPDTSSREKEK